MKTTNSTIGQALRVALLASTVGLGAMAWSVPAFAQDDKDKASDEASPAIVVTGSRIARKGDLDSNSPMVTVDQQFLQESSTAAVEQQLNKLPQFVVSQSSTTKNNEGVLLNASGDIQPNATNTPGAATVSLRGIGANRTLVLIDGRRGAPGNASGAVDISTIPSAALERVEVISGGASATYGADAVAGVTNFILKKNFKGLELDGTLGFDGHGGGLEYQISGIMGADIDGGRGNVSLAMSINTREKSLQRDNPFFQSLWANPNTSAGAFFFVPRPGVQSVDLKDATSFSAQFGNAANTSCQYFCSAYLNSDGSIFTANSYNTRGAGAAFLKPWSARDNQVGAIWKTTSVGTLVPINGLSPETVPTDRYNFLGRGNYEINDWLGMFATGMFSNSSTYTVQEPGPLVGGWGVNVPWGTGTYTGNAAVPSSVLANGTTTNPAFQALYPNLGCAGYISGLGGCTNTEAFRAVVPASIQALLNARSATPDIFGQSVNSPFALAGYLPLPRTTISDVTTYSLTAGFEGKVPGTDWTWEAFGSHSVARTSSTQTGMYSLARMQAVFTAPNMGQGFKYVGNPSGGNFGAATGACTTGLNFFAGYQGASNNCLEAITADVSNVGSTRQTIAEANMQGGLFDLPAGQLRFALGASYRETRYSFENETLSTSGRSFLDQTVGIYPSANMPNAGYNTKELYGELLVPVLADIPFIKKFDLELGGRISDYTTTGTSYTFKILGDWQVNRWLRFRGGFNRAERAPNIAELLLTPQQTFSTDPTGDVCSTRHQLPGSANPTVNPTGALSVEAICLELMARDNGGVYVPVQDSTPAVGATPAFNSPSYYDATQAVARQPTGAGGGFFYAVGNQYYRQNIDPATPALKPEVADTITLGAVIQSPFSAPLLQRLSLTIDYFNIKINNPIGNVGAGGVELRCVDPDFNPAAAGVASGATNASQLNTPAIRAKAQAAIQQSTCPSVYRNTSDGTAANYGQLNTNRMYSTYDNDGLIKLSGIDANLSWSTPVGPGTLSANVNFSYNIDFKVQGVTGAPILDYVGTTGTGVKGVNFGSSYQYKVLSMLGYNWKSLNVSLQWQHNPAIDDSSNVSYLNGLSTTPTTISGTPAYDLFNLNASYQVNRALRVRAGVDNLFNRAPDITGVATGTLAAGQVPGGSYSFLEDTVGRRISLGANVKF